MNITLFALTRTLMLSAPLLSFTSSSSPFSLSCSNIWANKFSTNFLYSSSKQIRHNFEASTFQNFISSALVVSQKDQQFINTNISAQVVETSSSLTISYCGFYNIYSEVRGGAIRYICEAGSVSVTGSIFQNCTSTSDGGAIFACGKEEHFHLYSYHLPLHIFDSQYCCYADCSVIRTNDDDGYGSAICLSAKDTRLFYSSTDNCPNGKASGAQFDLNSTYILSSFINATTGNSIYCAAIEYRDTENGTFEFQTIVGQSGRFIISFTNLKEDVSISNCNILNCSIDLDTTPEKQYQAVIHVRVSKVSIDSFCFVDITYQDGAAPQLISGGDYGTYSLSNSFIYLGNSITPSGEFDSSNKIETNSEEKRTHTFQLLGLGKCGGEVVVPTPQFNKSHSFTPSNSFSNSNSFTKSFEFTKSNEVVPNANVGNDKGSNEAMIGGIVAAAVAVVAVVAGVIFYFVRKNKLNVQLENGADLETADSVVQQSNPLYNNEGQDDPFQEDFDATNL